MAFIPKYESKRSVTSSGGFTAFKAQPEAGELLQQTGQLMTDTAMKLTAIQGFKEKTEAQLKLQESLSEIKTRWEQDQDTSEENMNKYTGEIESAVSNSGKNISVPGDRDKFGFIARDLGQNYKVGLQSHMYSKAAKQADFSIAMQEQTTVELAAQQGSLEATASAVTTLDETYKDMIEKGFISAEEANARKHKVQQSAFKALYGSMAVTDAERAETELNDKAVVDALYKVGLTDADISSIRYDATRMKIAQENQKYVVQKQTQAENAQKIMNIIRSQGALAISPAQVREQAAAGNISTAAAGSIVKYMFLDPAVIQHRDEIEQQLQKELFEFYDDDKEMMKFGSRELADKATAWHEHVLEAVADGYLTPAKYDRLMGVGGGLVYDAVKLKKSREFSDGVMGIASRIFVSPTHVGDGIIQAIHEYAIQGKELTPEKSKQILIDGLKQVSPSITDQDAEALISTGGKPTLELTFNAETNELE